MFIIGQTGSGESVCFFSHLYFPFSKKSTWQLNIPIPTQLTGKSLVPILKKQKIKSK